GLSRGRPPLRVEPQEHAARGAARAGGRRPPGGVDRRAEASASFEPARSAAQLTSQGHTRTRGSVSVKEREEVVMVSTRKALMAVRVLCAGAIVAACAAPLPRDAAEGEVHVVYDPTAGALPMPNDLVRD